MKLTSCLIGLLASGLSFSTIAAPPAPIVDDGAADARDKVERRVQRYIEAYAPGESFEYAIGVSSNGVFVISAWGSQEIPPPVLLDNSAEFPSLEVAEAPRSHSEVTALPGGRKGWAKKSEAVVAQIKKLKAMEKQEKKPEDRRAAEREFFKALKDLDKELKKVPGYADAPTTLDAALAAIDLFEDPLLAGRFTRRFLRVDLALSRFNPEWEKSTLDETKETKED